MASADDSASASATAYAGVKITPDPGFPLTLDGMHGTETLGRPFLYTLDLSSGQAKGDLQSMLGSAITLSIKQGDSDKRYFNGILTRIAYAGRSGGVYRYHVEMRPKIWLLSRIQDCCIFQNQSAWTTITAVLRNAGFDQFQDKRQSQSGEIVLDYCVQYRETTLDFITRLMEQFGIYYYFQHQDGQHTLILADDPNSHTALTDSIPYQIDRTEHRVVKDHIWEWTSDLNLQPGAVTYRDYNFTTPTADLTAKSLQAGSHQYGSYEVYDYPGPYDTAGNGQKLADVRMQNLTAQRQTFQGTSNARGLYAGCKFTLSQSTDSAQNREYLVTGATISISMAESMADTRGELTDTYRCVLHAVTGDTHFRLDPATRRPLVQGPQTAKVVGESGQEITTDQYGRIKVKFYWDRSATQDENSSCWIRVAQPWAGAGWGSMVIPRIGQEVVVEFLEGNPDRPLVTGTVYNANNTVPYPLPANKTRSAFKTSSSTGGSGANEFRFEDKAGSEEVFFQAQKDYNKKVLNNETVTITQDHSTTVSQGNHSTTISQGNHSSTVSQGNHSLTVSAGNHKIDVSAGTSALTAAQSITLTVGGNSIKIDTSGVTITTVGPIQMQAGGAVSVESGAAMSMESGAAMSMEAGAPMSLTAPLININ